MASMDIVQQTAFMPFDPIVKRTEGTIIEKGVNFKTSKGAPHVLMNLVSETNKDKAYVSAMRKRVEADVQQLGQRGIRSLAVAKTKNGDIESWEMMGMLTFLDPPRPDTKQTIADAIKFGVAVKMITGDHFLIAKETARVLDMGDYIKDAAGLPMLHPVTKTKPEGLSRDYGDMCLAADGFSQVYPEHKYLIVECLRELGYKVCSHSFTHPHFYTLTLIFTLIMLTFVLSHAHAYLHTLMQFRPHFLSLSLSLSYAHLILTFTCSC
jgi:H+-transporting ATPase